MQNTFQILATSIRDEKGAEPDSGAI